MIRIADFIDANKHFSEDKHFFEEKHSKMKPTDIEIFYSVFNWVYLIDFQIQIKQTVNLIFQKPPTDRNNEWVNT